MFRNAVSKVKTRFNKNSWFDNFYYATQFGCIVGGASGLIYGHNIKIPDNQHSKRTSLKIEYGVKGALVGAAMPIMIALSPMLIPVGYVAWDIHSWKPINNKIKK